MPSGSLPLLLCAAGVAVFGTTLTAAATIGGPTASLVVTVDSEASDCPAREALAAEINRVAKREAVTTNDSMAVATRLTLVMSRMSGAYHGTLRVQGELAGERVFEDDGANCSGLARAISVSTALLLDHIESTRSVSRPEVTPTPPRSVSRPLKYGIELGAGVSWGLTRPASLGYTLESLIGSGQFVAGVGGLWIPGRRHSAPPGEVEVSLSAVTTRGCLIMGQSGKLGLSLWGCGRGLAGWIHASAAGFQGAKDVRRTWIGAAAELDLVGRLFGPLHWVMRVDGIVPVLDERFTVTVDGQRRVAFDPAKAGVLGSVGLMVSNF